MSSVEHVSRMSAIHGQRQNAHLPADGQLQVRVGIPKPGGALMSEANNAGYPVMVSAAAFWRDGLLRATDLMRSGEIYSSDLALDSAGFTAMAGWAKKGPQAGMANVYPWTLQEYLDLAQSLGSACSWYAQPDFCCEPEIARDRAERRRRVELTAIALGHCLQETQIREVLAERDFAHIKSATRRRILTIENCIRPPVPVLQGWDADDYRCSAELLRNTWQPWERLYGIRLIGLGSVCRRSLNDPKHGVFAILRGIEDLIPPGAKLHLFGVKGRALRELAQHPLVASADSMAYDFQARMTAARERRSNAMSGRIQAMHTWMDRNAPSHLCDNLVPQLALF
jgi:hypothetical protein